MDAFKIQGGTKLEGKVKISSSKNACLPIMAGTLLTKDTCVLNEMPGLVDISMMGKVLEKLGQEVATNNQNISLKASDITSIETDYELVRKMRASILVLGPLLARFGEAKVSLPGGCAIGGRPIDIHLEGLKKMGAKIDLKSGYVHAKVKGKLTGCNIPLPFPSVGATENLMMAAALADGETVIQNAAKEPEITDLGNFLNSMKANIKGHGTSTIVVKGVNKLSGTTYTPIKDRIEGLTFIALSVLTDSKLEIEGINPNHLLSFLELIKLIGVSFEINNSTFKLLDAKNYLEFHIETSPYPGFPTDGQAQVMAMALRASKTSTITESIFENRFMHVPELRRLGAEIVLKKNTAIIKPIEKLTGAQLMCTDLRASAALVLAALAAEGESIIRRVYHIDRGYDSIDSKLRSIGAKIERINI